MRFTRLIRALHRVIAIAISIPLLILALSGALLVFPETLDRIGHDDRVEDPANQTIRPASELLRAAQAVLPAEDRVIRMQYPKAVGQTLIAQTKEERIVVLDPSTAKVIRVVQPDGFDLHQFLVRLHVNLFAGKIGAWITGLTAVGLFLLCSSGLYLWWPRQGWAWHYFLIRFRSGRVRLNYDLHRASGFYCSIPLTLIAFTGAMMAFYGFLTPAVYWLTGSTPKAPAPSQISIPSEATEPLSADQIVALAQAHVPYTVLYRLYPPKSADTPYRVFLVPEADRLTRFQETRLVIDPYRGEILYEEGPRTMSMADRILRWILPLHFGTFGGSITQLLYLVVSLSPVLLMLTGLFIWRKRQRAKRSHQPVRIESARMITS